MTDTNALRTRIAAELRRSDLTTQINREINAAISHYESTRVRGNENREATLGTTISGTKTYSLPADFVRMDTLKLVYNGGYIPIHKKTWDEIESKDTRVTGTLGLPHDYVVYGNVLRLYPAPNGAYTLIGSYIQRYLPTSLTGSFCSLFLFGGRSSVTITTTASHNNRITPWTTDGEELIRARAKAAVRINYLKDPMAIAEAGGLAASRLPFLSIAERQAFEKLSDETNDAISTGMVRPYSI